MTFLETLSPEKRQRLRTLAAIAILGLLFLLFMGSGIRDQVSLENVRQLGSSPATIGLIVLAMTGAWTFALPASVFFFIAPLLFPPLVATGVICLGSATGTTMGYAAARYVGGPWVERFKDHRVTEFLREHSSFASLFAVRVFPSSPHGFLNYGAGLVRIPFMKFLTATLCGVGIKAFLYATAISGGVEAANVKEALSWPTVGALSALGVLALIGHFLHRRWRKQEESPSRLSTTS
jgi:uncharacterized membrane protein YdjX (TVP38/TMEM64 family)